MATEKQKMLSSQWYNPRDQRLVKLRQKAKTLCHEFNQLSPQKNSQRKALIQQLLRVKGRTDIESPFFCDYGVNIQVGQGFYANHGCTILDAAEVVIGDHCMLGPNVVISTVNHHHHHLRRPSEIARRHADSSSRCACMAGTMSR